MAVLAAIARLTRLRNTVKPGDLSPPNETGDVAFPLAAAVLEFHIIKADAEPIRADLLDSAVIIEIDIVEAGPPCRATDRGAAGLNGVATQLAFLPERLAPLIG
ncbi:MAG TPA: hypothetical protein DHV57_03135, partial [Hyphomonas sp.]|nr:hypothetical protein [Hyphomonas sp.]